VQIDLRNDELVIVADRRYVAQLRALPDRRWDSVTKLWYASYTKENYEQMAALGWPIAHIQAPARSSFFLDLVRMEGQAGTFFMIRTPGRPELIDLCRRIPEHRAWSTANRCWLCRPTPLNIAYIRQHLPQLQISPAAAQKMGKLAEQSEPPAHLVVPSQPVDISDFKFKTKPYAHQLEAFALSRDRQNFALLMEQRTGKTKVVIDTGAYLRMRGEIEAVLIICPNSVKDIWPEELAAHLPDWAESSIFVDGAGRFDAMCAFNESPKVPLKWLITNVEALTNKEREKEYARFLARHRTLVAVDEFTRFKNPTAQRTRALLRLQKYAMFRRILSGTPVTQNPLDIYAPFKFLDSAILGFSTFTQCKQHHAILGGWQARQVVGFVKLEEIAAKVAPHSYRKLARDAFDLPPVLYKKRVVELSPKARKIYDALRDELVAELDSGQKITTAHALVKLLRLAQITGGFVTPDVQVREGDLDDEGWNTEAVEALEKAEPQQIEDGNPKLAELLAIIADLPSDDKVVIWARFVPEVELIRDALREVYGSASTVDFHGAVKNADRTIARLRFQGGHEQVKNADGTVTKGEHRDHDTECRFFVGQVETGGAGIKLSRANTEIYYSNSFSLETRLQSEMRLIDDQKIGKCVIDLVSKNTLNTKLLSDLRRKKRFADSITGDSWKEWL